MEKNVKRYSIFLSTLLLGCILTPSNAFFHFGGGGGGGGMGGMGGGGSSSDVAEILAAGLITRMLMDDFIQTQGSQMFQTLRHSLMGAYSHHPPPIPHVRHYPSMVAPRLPMAMRAQYIVPVVHRYPFHLMSQAPMMPQPRHRGLVPNWGGPLRGSATMMNAYMPIRREEPEPGFIDQLLSNEALSAATILLNSDLLDDDEDDEDTEDMELREAVSGAPESTETPEIAEKTTELPPDTIEASASDHQSRYILPRIVKHFVQRIMRRVENH